jgi:hypothetical protein
VSQQVCDIFSKINRFFRSWEAQFAQMHIFLGCNKIDHLVGLHSATGKTKKIEQTESRGEKSDLQNQ